MSGNRQFDPSRHPAGDPGPLFSQAPRIAGSDTSEQAARGIEPSAGTLRGKVLELLTRKNRNDVSERGWTDEEVQGALGMNPSTQRPRRVELVEAGLVEDSGRTRRTATGRKAVVWVAVVGEPKPKLPKPPVVDWERRAMNVHNAIIRASCGTGAHRTHAELDIISDLLSALQEWDKPLEGNK